MICLFYCDWFEEYTANLALAVAGESHTVSMIVREQAPEFTGQGRVSDGDEIRRELRASINTLYVLQGKYRSIRSLLSIRRMVRESRPDVFHIQQTGDPRFLWFAYRLPTVMTLHEPFAREGNLRTGGLRQTASKVVQGLYRRFCDLIIVHTQTSLQGLSPAERRKAIVIPHGVPVSAVDLSPESETILFFGRADGYKGLGDLVSAMQIVWKSKPGARLRILASQGNCQFEPSDDRITASWCGFSRAELQAALSNSRAVSLPYTTASGSGVATQAYGAGMPIVASNLEGLREFVANAELLVTPGDVDDLARALVHVLTHDYGPQPVDATRTWPGVARTHLRAYAGTLSRKTKRPC